MYDFIIIGNELSWVIVSKIVTKVAKLANIYADIRRILIYLPLTCLRCPLYLLRNVSILIPLPYSPYNLTFKRIHINNLTLVLIVNG